MKKLIFTIAIVAIAQCSALAQNFEWAKRAGGTLRDIGTDIATDASGNCYITGTFLGAATFGSTTLSAPGIYIAKLDTEGNFLWVTRAGGTTVGQSFGIAIDAVGNCYVTGNFSGTTDFGNITLTASSDGMNIFIAKLDTEGNFLWAKGAGGSVNAIQSGLGIATDNSENCYVTGYFGGTTNFGGISLTASSATNAFFAKLDTEGNFLWVKKAGGQILDTRGYDIATDASGNCYATGYFRDEALFGSTGLSATRSGFITKLDTDGNFLWAKRAGGSTYAESKSIATDASGNCYATGNFDGSASFGTTTLTTSGSNKTFITKLNTEGNFLWATIAGGFAKGIATDISGNCYVTGLFNGTVNIGTTALTSSGGRNHFITKLDTEGEFLWAQRAGGIPEIEEFNGHIATDASGNCYATGWFSGTADFGATTLTSSGTQDIFITKITEGTTSISETTTGFSTAVFPNPTNSILNINSTALLTGINVLNSLGELVQTETRNSFSIEHLPAGVYMLQIQTEKGITTTRMIKE